MKKLLSLAVSGIAALAVMSATNIHAATIDFNSPTHNSGDHITLVNFGFGSADVSAVGGIDEAWIFDTNTTYASSNPAFGDPDLLSNFSTTDGTITGHNAGNVLIIQESDASHGGNTNNTPDDNVGGTLTFEFNAPVVLKKMDVMDMDAGDAIISLFDISGNRIKKSATEDSWLNLTNADTGNGTTPNLFETITFSGIAGISGVKTLEIVFNNSSGAIDNIEVSAVPLPAAAPLFASVLGLFGFLQSRRTPGQVINHLKFWRTSPIQISLNS